MPRPPRPISDALLYRVATLLLKEGLSPQEIAKKIEVEFPQEKNFTRQSVYRYIPDAVERGFVRLVSPLDAALAEKLANVTRWGLTTDQLHIVPTSSASENMLVAIKAAEVVLELIRRKQKDLRRNVRLGLGPGRGTKEVAEALGQLLKGETEIGKFDLHAIAAGCPARAPEFSSPSFFNLFPRQSIGQKIGLFAESTIKVKDFTLEFQQRPGLAEAFESRDEIDIVVSAMGVFEDTHDLLRAFLDDRSLERMEHVGVVGNVQYRPYTNMGPYVERDDDWRAITLFELSDFAKMVREGHRRVVLIARQCGVCGMTRARALRPLLEVPELRVFSELVMDAATALELLSPRCEDSPRSGDSEKDAPGDRAARKKRRGGSKI